MLTLTKWVDIIFQTVKIVVISGISLPLFGHIRALSLTHYHISFIVSVLIPLLTDYFPLTPSLFNPFSIIPQVRRCHGSKPENIYKNYMVIFIKLTLMCHRGCLYYATNPWNIYLKVKGEIKWIVATFNYLYQKMYLKYL